VAGSGEEGAYRAGYLKAMKLGRIIVPTEDVDRDWREYARDHLRRHALAAPAPDGLRANGDLIADALDMMIEHWVRGTTPTDAQGKEATARLMSWKRGGDQPQSWEDLGDA